MLAGWVNIGVPMLPSVSCLVFQSFVPSWRAIWNRWNWFGGCLRIWWHIVGAAMSSSSMWAIVPWVIVGRMRFLGVWPQSWCCLCSLIILKCGLWVRAGFVRWSILNGPSMMMRSWW